jgi:hypothetical protein
MLAKRRARGWMSWNHVVVHQFRHINVDPMPKVLYGYAN